MQQAARADAIYFGSLAQRSDVSTTTIQTFVHATPRDAIRVCDVTVRQPFFTSEVLKRCLQLANVIKISDEELPLILNLLKKPDSDPISALDTLR